MRLAQEVGKVLLAQAVQVQMEVLFGRGYPVAAGSAVILAADRRLTMAGGERMLSRWGRPDGAACRRRPAPAWSSARGISTAAA